MRFRVCPRTTAPVKAHPPLWHQVPLPDGRGLEVEGIKRDRKVRKEHLTTSSLRCLRFRRFFLFGVSLAAAAAVGQDVSLVGVLHQTKDVTGGGYRNSSSRCRCRGRY